MTSVLRDIKDPPNKGCICRVRCKDGRIVQRVVTDRIYRSPGSEKTELFRYYIPFTEVYFLSIYSTPELAYSEHLRWSNKYMVCEGLVIERVETITAVIGSFADAAGMDDLCEPHAEQSDDNASVKFGGPDIQRPKMKMSGKQPGEAEEVPKYSPSAFIYQYKVSGAGCHGLRETFQSPHVDIHDAFTVWEEANYPGGFAGRFGPDVQCDCCPLDIELEEDVSEAEENDESCGCCDCETD